MVNKGAEPSCMEACTQRRRGEAQGEAHGQPQEANRQAALVACPPPLPPTCRRSTPPSGRLLLNAPFLTVYEAGPAGAVVRGLRGGGEAGRRGRGGSEGTLPAL